MIYLRIVTNKVQNSHYWHARISGMPEIEATGIIEQDAVERVKAKALRSVADAIEFYHVPYEELKFDFGCTI